MSLKQEPLKFQLNTALTPHIGPGDGELKSEQTVFSYYNVTQKGKDIYEKWFC